MSFEFRKCFAGSKEISGLREIQPRVFGDARGCFFESYSERDFFAAGISERFVQDNQSSSSRGVLRGLHFQTRRPQGKLVRAVLGRVYDVAVDIRLGSPTFGSWYGVTLDAERQNQLYIPRGFAHGFCALTDLAVFAYKCTDFYDPEGEGGLPWDDPAIGIAWGDAAPGMEPLLSEKDRRHPAFRADGHYFDMDGRWIGE